MRIANLLNGRTFDADMIAIIATAFDAACQDLGLTDRRDPITETLAMKIIEAAQTGVRDPDAIRQQAIHALADSPSLIPVLGQTHLMTERPGALPPARRESIRRSNVKRVHESPTSLDQQIEAAQGEVERQDATIARLKSEGLEITDATQHLVALLIKLNDLLKMKIDAR